LTKTAVSYGLHVTYMWDAVLTTSWAFSLTKKTATI